MPKLLIILFASIFLFACNKKDVKYLDFNKPHEITPNPNIADAIKPGNFKDSIDSQKTAPTPTPVPTDTLKINFNNSNKNQTNMVNTFTIKTAYGDIVIKPYIDKAPNFINNFASKIQNKYFDGLTFHRVEPGFVVQGGDPKGNGTGGGQIASEMNDVPFVRGSVGVARGPDININNDSQFYICLTTKACSPLTSQYTNFGEVISGMEFVDQIKVGDKILSITAQ
jgi:peptidylprolyl isomerase